MTNKNLTELKDKVENNTFKSSEINALLGSVYDSWEDITEVAKDKDEEKRNQTWYEVDRVSDRIATFLYLAMGALAEIENTNQEVIKGLVALANAKEGDC